MGAYYEEARLTAESEKELKDKYQNLVAHEQYMNGHGGYSGTFAEKPQLRIIRGMYNPTTEDEAYEHCSNENDKWGPAFAYYVGDYRWYIGGWCSS